MIPRKSIKDFLTANPASLESAIVADCVTNDVKENRARRVLQRMVERNNVVKTGDNYSLAP